MPVCPTCGSQQPDGAAFCDECGAKLEALLPAAPAARPPVQAPPTALATACPVCGRPVVPGEPFCNNCGAALGPGAPVSPPVGVAPAPTPAGTLTCSTCGAQLEPGSVFCDMCGASVSAAPVSSPPPVTPPPPVDQPGYPPVQTWPQPGYPPPPPEPQPGYTPTPGYPPFIPPYRGGGGGCLVIQGTNATLPFPPGKTEFFVGREDPVSGIFPDVDLTDHGGDEGGVSRQHARIFIQGNQVFIEDLNSTNYTHVNQQRLTPRQPHPLNNGDEVRLGRVKLNYYSA